MRLDHVRSRVNIIERPQRPGESSRRHVGGRMRLGGGGGGGGEDRARH